MKWLTLGTGHLQSCTSFWTKEPDLGHARHGILTVPEMCGGLSGGPFYLEEHEGRRGEEAVEVEDLPSPRSGLFTEVAQGLYNVLQAGASGTGHGSSKTWGMMDGGLNAG